MLAVSRCSGFGSSTSYNETLRTTTNRGASDTAGYVLGRLPDGLHAYALRDFFPNGVPVPGWDGGYLLAEALGTSRPNVGRIEREVEVRLSTLERYVEALGGKLEIHAVFDDAGIKLTA